MGIQSMDFLVNDFTDVNDNIRLKRIRFLEMVLVIKKYRVSGERRRVCGNIRNPYHKSGILYQYPGIPMVGMIVVGSMGDHHIGFPIPDPADNFQADGERWGMFVVVVVQYLVGNSQAFGHLLCLGGPAFGQYTASLFHVSRISIGDGKKLYLMAHLCK